MGILKWAVLTLRTGLLIGSLALALNPKLSQTKANDAMSVQESDIKKNIRHEKIHAGRMSYIMSYD